MRPTLPEYLLELARVSASRATCPKRQVGAVVADEHGVVIGTGYNGVPRGIEHCTDKPCSGVGKAAPHSHQHCNAVHAEVNALLTAGHRARGGYLAVTTSPCKECAKVIVNAGIKWLIVGEFNRLWDDREAYGTTPKELLLWGGVNLIFCTEQA